MPGMSGAEIFQNLRAVKPDVSVIICSGYSYKGLAGIEELMKAGAREFVQKPFTKQTVGAAIKKVLSDV